MGDTGGTIARKFRKKRYDLAQSTYSLYYSKNRRAVLDAMRKSLKPGGRLAVCTPNDPHSLSLFCGRIGELPPEVVACGKFGAEVLEPYFREHFTQIDIHLLRNVMRFPTVDDVMELIHNAAYFDASKEARLRTAIGAEIKKNGHFQAEKNSYLIVGHVPKK
jgi:SAM-dependent methyltransferase